MCSIVKIQSVNPSLVLASDQFVVTTNL